MSSGLTLHVARVCFFLMKGVCYRCSMKWVCYRCSMKGCVIVVVVRLLCKWCSREVSALT